MRASAHLRLLGTAVLVWAAFWVVGWPHYYQHWPTWLVALGCVAILPPTAWFGFRAIDRARPARRLPLALWLAFWFSAPLLLLDASYCGWWLGHGVGFLGRYWYLTLYYVLPWVLWPAWAALGPTRHDARSP